MKFNLRILILLAFAFGGRWVSAQTDQAGFLYFAVEDLDNRRVVQRGTTDPAGSSLRQVNLAPNTNYRLWLLDGTNLRIARGRFSTLNPAQPYVFPPMNLTDRPSHDADDDGLPDLAEFIVGTDGQDPDTDGDGVSDGAEVRQGLNPADGRPVRTGVIGTADTPGRALHVSAFNDLAVVSDGDQGISVFNIFNTMNPVIVAQVDTPGTAVGSALSGNLIAVADQEAGLAVVDIDDPPAAFIRHQLLLGSPVRVVAAPGPTAYAGLADGRLVAVDLGRGIVVDQLSLPDASVHDLAAAGDELYVLTEASLRLFDLRMGRLAPLGSLPVAGVPSPQEFGRKLFAGDGLAYVGYFTGWSVIDATDPMVPVLVGSPPATQLAVHDLTANGSGLALHVTSFSGPESLRLTLYDASDPNDVTRALTSFDTPGDVRSVAVYNGLAYLADDAAGLQVFNYQSFDTARQAPSITLATSSTNQTFEEGQPFRVTARVTDDVQVRNVEFYLDGSRVATDGNFPFEIRFLTPLITGGRTSFTLRGRASDTGGNAAFSEERVIQLTPDVRPPEVVRTFPEPGGYAGALPDVLVYMSESVSAASLSPASFQIISAGSDGLIATADDLPVAGGQVSFQSGLNALFLSFDPGLSPGLYRATVGPPLADVRGNVMASPFTWTFRILGFVDSDLDGLPDDLEPSLGLNPLNRDSDGDGVTDGREDLDADGLSNVGEVVMGTNPDLADSDDNGVPDGDEDRDNDALPDGQEIDRGTNPFAHDSDADGWPDESEVLVGTDPLDETSRPRPFVAGRPPAIVTVLGTVNGDGSGAAVVRAQPSVNVLSLGVTNGDGSGSAVRAGRPFVEIIFE